mmetsp:Transcript_45826/g.91413  ORF Transcript_45826/g.91413 Transcript_45826/m.91413 type:complete len:260 (+) Transcript_45826:423-1202(+)
MIRPEHLPHMSICELFATVSGDGTRHHKLRATLWRSVRGPLVTCGSSHHISMLELNKSRGLEYSNRSQHVAYCDLKDRANEKMHHVTLQTKSQRSRCLERMLVCHDPHELILIHLPIAIQISLIDHLLQLLICHVLAQLARHALKVAERDLARLVVIEELEDAPYFLWRIPVAHLPCHHLHKLLKVDSAGSVQVNVGNHFPDFLLLRVEAKRAQSYLKLFRVNGAGSIRIEQVKCLTQLLHLPLWDSRACRHSSTCLFG